MAFQGDSIFWVEVEKIVANPYQPRREFDEAKLKELAESVRMYGILQPLTVTRKEVPAEDGSFRSEYELISGERRLRASRIAGLSQVPVIIREGEQSEQEKLELAIIENLQREDLNAVDKALAFRQLADVFGLSHSQVAKKVGRSREYVSNSIRILALPDYMLNAVRTADISEGHARTLLMLNDRPEEQDTVFREILLKKLTVRDVERIARGIAVEKTRRKDNVDVDLLELERQFTETLGTRVSIVKTDFGGKMTIDYFSQEDLEAILLRMKDEAKQITNTSAKSLVADANYDSVELTEAEEKRIALDTLTQGIGLEEAKDEIVPVEVDHSSGLPSDDYDKDTKLTIPPSILPTAVREIAVPLVKEEKDEMIVPIIAEETLVNLEAEKSAQFSGPISTATVSAPSPEPTSIIAKSNNSLREQLASLLGHKSLTEIKTEANSSFPSKSELPTTPPVTLLHDNDNKEIKPLSVTTPKVNTEKNDDDSKLYSMNNFGI